MPADTGHRWLLLLAAVAACCALAASVTNGAPDPLPDLALGWPLILHLERAGFVALLILGVGGIVLGVLRGGTVQATGGGPLPSVDISAPADDVRAKVDSDFEDVQARLTRLEQRVLRLEARGIGES